MFSVVGSDEIDIGFTRLLSFVRGVVVSLWKGGVKIMLGKTSHKLLSDAK